jgi:hypothetical protein
MQRRKAHLLRRLEKPRRIGLVLLIVCIICTLDVASALAALALSEFIF